MVKLGIVEPWILLLYSQRQNIRWGSEEPVSEVEHRWTNLPNQWWEATKNWAIVVSGWVELPLIHYIHYIHIRAITYIFQPFWIHHYPHISWSNSKCRWASPDLYRLSLKSPGDSATRSLLRRAGAGPKSPWISMWICWDGWILTRHQVLVTLWFRYFQTHYWWVVWNFFFYFFKNLNSTSDWLIFFRGVAQPPIRLWTLIRFRSWLPHFRWPLTSRETWLGVRRRVAKSGWMGGLYGLYWLPFWRRLDDRKKDLTTNFWVGNPRLDMSK